jgi:hypothetical protein
MPSVMLAFYCNKLNKRLLKLVQLTFSIIGLMHALKDKIFHKSTKKYLEILRNTGKFVCFQYVNSYSYSLMFPYIHNNEPCIYSSSVLIPLATSIITAFY